MKMIGIEVNQSEQLSDFLIVKFSENSSIDDEFLIIPFSHNPFIALLDLLDGDWLVVFEDKLLLEKLPPLIVTCA